MYVTINISIYPATIKTSQNAELEPSQSCLLAASLWLVPWDRALFFISEHAIRIIDRWTITCCLMSDIVFCREWTSPGDTIWGTTSVTSSDIFLRGTDRQTNGHIDRQKITCCLMSDMVLCSEWTSPGDTIWGTDIQTDRQIDNYLLFDVRHCVL